MLYQIFRSLIEYSVLVVLFVISSWLIWRYLTTPNNLPPGPWGLPIVGYIPFLGDKPHEHITGLRKRYGDVMTISVGIHHAFVLNSFSAVTNAFVKQADVFSARPVRFVPAEFRTHRGLSNGTGESWAEYRRFTILVLKDFGIGRSTIEPQIKDEIHNFLNVIESHEGKPADICGTLRLSITNIICSIITGRLFEYDDPLLLELVKVSEDIMRSLGYVNLEYIIPNIPYKLKILKFFGMRTPIIPGLKMVEILNKVIEKYEKNHQPGSKDSYIDAWLTEMEKQGSSKKLYNKRQLAAVLNDLFIAGSDTISTTISWGLLYLMKHPEIQQKIHQEIDEVVGRERSPTFADQNNMPYTEATILEVSRIASVAPFSIIHSTHRDTTLNGYFIPKDALVLPNLWAVHHDPDVFPDPHDFKPERFLTDNNQIKKVDQLIPFSIGKRQCMGEALSRMELFLYFTSILQQYTIRKVEGTELRFDHYFASISSPYPYKLCAIKR